MDLLQARLGFGFSAGLFDYVLNYGKSTHPLYLFPVGAAYFALYYFLFRYCIVKFDLRTPGREPAGTEVAPAPAAGATAEADAYIAALGGAANLASVEACTTRLRLELVDRERVDAETIKRLGARGSVRVGAAGLQVVVGPMADQLASEIRARLRANPEPAAGLLAALGGHANVRRIEAAAGRLMVTVGDARGVDERALMALGARGVAVVSPTSVHVLHPAARDLEKGLAPLVA
jgi:PTS system N-acetylglucosamine-specific IIC component